jgi:hypothetical protein
MVGSTGEKVMQMLWPAMVRKEVRNLRRERSG